MLHPASFLFITLDSCRYDTFAQAEAPNLKAIGLLHRAQAPSHFTYGSHAAMFVGFTPGIAEQSEPYVNPKFGKIFKLEGAASGGRAKPWISLEGRTIIDGLRQRGYRAFGTGAVAWFNTNTLGGQHLTEPFDAFWYAGATWRLQQQLAWLDEQLQSVGEQPVFAFLNVGETHVPYWYKGAPWGRSSPCIPFAETNDASECQRRQQACLEWVDEKLGPLLARFAHANTLVCADHGDAWGEDGLWEHGVSHPKVLEVPLLFCLQHRPEL